MSGGWIAPVMVFVAMFLAMEGVAWFSHKYVMHGFMWGWHASHHEPRAGAFEKNDLFAFFFAAVSIALFAAGFLWHRLFLAAGTLLYKFAGVPRSRRSA